MTEEQSWVSRALLERRLDQGVWGVFFVWIGLAVAAEMHWGIWLAGVGGIALCAQVLRLVLALHLEKFWVGAGILFLLGGLSQLLPPPFHVSLVAILCVAAGLVLLVRALTGWRHVRPG